jgi:hypothetical protein
MNVDWPIAEESTYTVKNEAPDNGIKRMAQTMQCHLKEIVERSMRDRTTIHTKRPLRASNRTIMEGTPTVISAPGSTAVASYERKVAQIARIRRGHLYMNGNPAISRILNPCHFRP